MFFFIHLSFPLPFTIPLMLHISGTVGCSTMELSITTLQQLAKEAVFLRDLVLLHCYSRYSGLQCQGTQSHYIAAAGTVDCSITGLQFLHCYSWYNMLQY